MLPPACPRSASPSARDTVPHIILGETCVDKRENRAGIPGGRLAGPVVAKVVQVDTQSTSAPSPRPPKAPNDAAAAPGNASARPCSTSSGRRRWQCSRA